MKFVIYPPVDADRLARLQAAAPGAEWVNAADEADAARESTGADAFLGKITPRVARPGRPAALGAGVHGQPRALPLPRAGRAPVRPDQHARAVRRRDRRPGDGLHPLLRPQPAHLHPPAARPTVRAGRRRGGAGRASRPGPGTVNAMDRATITCPTRPWASSASGRSASRSRGGPWRSGCGSWPSTAAGPTARPEVDWLRPAAELPALAGRERLRRDRRPAHAGDGRPVRPGRSSGDEAVGLPDQHRPRGDRRARRPGRAPCGPARSPARRSTCSRSSRCRPTTRSGTSRTSSSRPHVAGYSPRSPRGTWACSSRTSAGSRPASRW